MFFLQIFLDLKHDKFRCSTDVWGPGHGVPASFFVFDLGMVTATASSEPP